MLIPNFATCLTKEMLKKNGVKKWNIFGKNIPAKIKTTPGKKRTQNNKNNANLPKLKNAKKRNENKTNLCPPPAELQVKVGSNRPPAWPPLSQTAPRGSPPPHTPHGWRPAWQTWPPAAAAGRPASHGPRRRPSGGPGGRQRRCARHRPAQPSLEAGTGCWEKGRHTTA